jgi:predicted DNA-binding protein
MAAKRTVDPAGKDRSTKMIAFRITTTQAEALERLAREHGVGRSAYIRFLLQKAITRG